MAPASTHTCAHVCSAEASGESEEPGATGRHRLEAEKPGGRASLSPVPPERGLVGRLGEDPALSPNPKGSRAVPRPPNCPSRRRMPHRPGLRARAGPRGCGPCGGRWLAAMQEAASAAAQWPFVPPAPPREAQPGQLSHQPVCPQVWSWLLSRPQSASSSPHHTPQPILPAAPPPALMGTPTPTRSPARTFVWHWFLPQSCTRSSCHPPGRMTWAWRAVGWPMLTIQDVGAHHGSAPPPVRTPLRGGSAAPQTCAGRGPGHPPCLLLVTALGLGSGVTAPRQGLGAGPQPSTGT